MSTHAFYVASAYGISALVIAAVAIWVLADQRARKRELAELEAAGIRRRIHAASPRCSERRRIPACSSCASSRLRARWSIRIQAVSPASTMADAP